MHMKGGSGSGGVRRVVGEVKEGLLWRFVMICTIFELYMEL